MAKSSLDICLLDTLLYFEQEEKERVEDIGGREELRELHREAEGKTGKERNIIRRGEDWGVVSLYGPINQHHSKGLGLSSYACTHTHTHPSVSPIIECPVVRVSDYKVPNWLFGQ